MRVEYTIVCKIVSSEIVKIKCDNIYGSITSIEICIYTQRNV